MAPVSDGKKKAPGQQAWTGAILKSAIGAPSAELSLVGLRPRRARLRFTRRANRSKTTEEEQEQWSASVANGLASTSVRLNPGGSVFRAEVGPFWAPITTLLWRSGNGISNCRGTGKVSVA